MVFLQSLISKNFFDIEILLKFATIHIMVYVLNGPILTNFGLFRYRRITILQAKKILKSSTFISAVGHEATAMLLSDLLEAEIKYNRVAIVMQEGDIAVVFHLLTRLEEGQILSISELCSKDYTLGLLKKLE
ncbi:DUF1874 domain-containing protein [Desulfurella amilsii]|uniref:DUF1874 domain-containing protein n=2 Tax=Desulfurella amilsii TaxID=1562698 RepID=A0A1X4XVI7_9BACT|nr:DUF1874 domain-containing protein [Desulfurella amilsii]